MTAHALLFTLAAIGISETAYLIKSRLHSEAPVCLIGGQSACRKVLESKYNHIFGIHNDVIGFLFYIGLTVMLGLIVIGIEPLQTWDLLAKISIAMASGFSLVLVLIQKFAIKSWCFWCLMSAFTNWLMLLIILLTHLI